MLYNNADKPLSFYLGLLIKYIKLILSLITKFVSKKNNLRSWLIT